MAMRDQTGSMITDQALLEELVEINRLPELIHSEDKQEAAQVSIMTRSRARSAPSRPLSRDSLTEEIVQEMRIERMLKAQDEEKWIVDLKTFLNGDLEKLSQCEAKDCVEIASSYEIDESDLLFYYAQADQADADLDRSARLVIPKTLQADILHHYYVSLDGGYQGVGTGFANISTGEVYIHVSKRLSERVQIAKPGRVCRISGVDHPETSSDLPFPSDSDGSNTFLAEIIQRQYRTAD